MIREEQGELFPPAVLAAYFIVDTAFLVKAREYNLTASATRLYLALCQHCFNSKFRCSPTRARLAAVTGLRDVHVSRARAELEEAELVTVVSQGVGRRPTEYELPNLARGKERMTDESRGTTSGTQKRRR